MARLTRKRSLPAEEQRRLASASYGAGGWRHWGPYLSERQWATVREDYSPNGDVWRYFPHEEARSRTYRWGEDGIAGISDDQQFLCFAFAFWNEQDPILKERLFGLTGIQGNHGEDVKEEYYYLDNTPTHSYMKTLYRYPQSAFPYQLLVEENQKRGHNDPEYELDNTGVFSDGRYFDCSIEYAKAGPDDILVQLTVCNRGREEAPLHVIPQLWFRNTWSWEPNLPRPVLHSDSGPIVHASHQELGNYWLAYDGEAEVLFCENETNAPRLFNAPNSGLVYKDGINDYLVGHQQDTLNTSPLGTKVGIHYSVRLREGETRAFRLRLSNRKHRSPFAHFDDLLERRKREANQFYREFTKHTDSDDNRLIQHRALAGLLWSKQFYCYDIRRWLRGDPAMPPPPAQRWNGRNNDWGHLNNNDIINMPDTWEYPWYASWDLAFHCVVLVHVDPEEAKRQLLLLTHEWYMSPRGQLPAYEWSFNNVNPPVQAWAAWKVYEADRRRTGRGDTDFLRRIFHKLLLNFTWWANRQDREERNIFEGGFLGLDNISVIDRSCPWPGGGILEQTDGTSWMAMYALNMLRIALELATVLPLYQDMATKFFEHFLYIAGAMANIGRAGTNLWDEEDQFFYDVLKDPKGNITPLKVRSVVGLTPLFAVEVLDPDLLKKVPAFTRRMNWFLDCRSDLANLVSRWYEPGKGDRRLLSLLRGHRMKKLLLRMLDPQEFLSEHGVRSLSRYHKDHPFELHLDGKIMRVDYEPAEARTDIFGGNSNWRGPVWFPINYLIIESLRRFHHYYGDDFLIEHPTGSGRKMTIAAIADDLARRLIGLFHQGPDGVRPADAGRKNGASNSEDRDLLLFYEYFNGDTGAGLGASHQTGWTALVANLCRSEAL